jgi:pyruvate/2-oxoglutarate dehydrogenase complex dihydrolipoamide acyltransferase (E2) component
MKGPYQSLPRSSGTVVQPGTTVCIIETMKVFVEIPAGGIGTIVEILVKNGQGVDYGQPLFRVETENSDGFTIEAFERHQRMIWNRITRHFGG